MTPSEVISLKPIQKCEIYDLLIIFYLKKGAQEAI